MTLKFLTYLDLFKYRPLSLAVVFGLPYYANKLRCDDKISERIDNLWKIHETRVNKGKKQSFLSKSFLRAWGNVPREWNLH